MIPCKTQIDAKHNRIISALFIYFAGFVLLCAFDTYCAINWFDLNNFWKIFLTLGVGTISYIAALFLLNKKNAYHFGIMLYFVSTIQLVTGLYVLFNMLGFLDFQSYYISMNPPDNNVQNLTMNTIVILSIITVQQVLTYHYLKPIEPIAAILLLTFLFLMGNILNYFGVTMEYANIIIGTFYLCAAYFLANTVFKKSSPIWNFIAAVNIFIGSYIVFYNLGVAGLFYVVTAVILYLSLIKNSLTLLYLTVFTIVTFTIDYTATYFSNMIGWPATLVLYSIVLMLISLIISNFSTIKSIFIKNKV